jgi:hypothetical protein
MKGYGNKKEVRSIYGHNDEGEKERNRGKEPPFQRGMVRKGECRPPL